MGFSRQEYWSGLPCPSPGDLPDPGIKPQSPALEADALTSEPPGKLVLSVLAFHVIILSVSFVPGFFCSSKWAYCCMYHWFILFFYCCVVVHCIHFYIYLLYNLFIHFLFNGPLGCFQFGVNRIKLLWTFLYRSFLWHMQWDCFCWFSLVFFDS